MNYIALISIAFAVLFCGFGIISIATDLNKIKDRLDALENKQK